MVVSPLLSTPKKWFPLKSTISIYQGTHLSPSIFALASCHLLSDKLYDILKLEYNRVNTNLRAHMQSQQSVCAICRNSNLITRNPLLQTDNTPGFVVSFSFGDGCVWGAWGTHFQVRTLYCCVCLGPKSQKLHSNWHFSLKLQKDMVSVLKKPRKWRKNWGERKGCSGCGGHSASPSSSPGIILLSCHQLASSLGRKHGWQQLQGRPFSFIQDPLPLDLEFENSGRILVVPTWAGYLAIEVD